MLEFLLQFWIIILCLELLCFILNHLLQEFSQHLSYFHLSFNLPALWWLGKSCLSRSPWTSWLIWIFRVIRVQVSFSRTLLLLLDKHFDDLALCTPSLSQQCTFLLKKHTLVLTLSNQSLSLPLSSSPNNWLYYWCVS